MRRFVTALVLIVISAVSIHADRLLSQAEEKVVIEKINRQVSGVKSINANFTQVKSLSLLKEELKANGILRYTAPANMHWEYTSPYKYVFEMSGDKVTITSSKGKNTVDAASSKLFKSITEIIMQTVTGKCLNANSRFKSRIYEAYKEYRVVLTPKSKQLASMFKTVTLFIPFSAPKSLPVRKIVITEPNSDTTTITFDLQK